MFSLTSFNLIIALNLVSSKAGEVQVDQKFAKDAIKRLDKGTTALIDGAYYFRRYRQES
jgi:hypothetical protein